MSYLLADQAAERERLRLQSRVWEPAGERLLARLGDGRGLRALEVGCGAMGWLRILSRWVGPEGAVVATDVDERMLGAAAELVTEEVLPNVALTRDDYFGSTLPAGSFDLVHLRFQVAPLGRGPEQVAIAGRLAKPGGWVVLEDPDTGSWRENPLAPSAAHLRGAGIEPDIAAECLALAPGHPYLQLPVQFAVSLQPRLLALIEEAELDRLIEAARAELADPRRWGTTFTLVQAWGRTPGPEAG